MITFNFIKYLIIFLKHKRILDQICEQENILNNLSELFGIQFRKNWMGNIYAIFNPVVNADPNELIFEGDEAGYNLKAFVDKKIMEKFLIAKEFVQDNNLFELLTYHIEEAEGDYNYLIILTPIAWYDLWKWTKKFIWVFPFIIAAIVTTLIILL